MSWFAKKGLFGLTRGMMIAIPTAAIILVVLVTVIWTNNSIGSNREKVQAELTENQTQATAESGAAAVEATANQAEAELAVDAITQENESEIRAAPGADQPINPNAHDAGLRSLCRRAAYSGHPQCVQQADPAVLP